MSSSFSPRVKNNNRADFYSIETFLNFHKFQNKSNEELILAIYDYLTSTEDGSYHFWDVEESRGMPNIRGVVIDPIKNLNVYGWFICGQMSYCLYRIYTTAGFKARQFSLPGHSVSEVFYEGAWHFLDVDMRTWFKNKNGQIASAVELSKNAIELIVENKNKSNPCNLPDRTLDGYACMFQKLKVENDDIVTDWARCSNQYHTMDFVLRPGESILKTPNENGCWHLPNRFLENINKYAGEWKNKPSERNKPFRTYGNGQWIYNPKLTVNSSDFKNGVFNQEGVTQNDNGLVGSNGSFADFYFYSPYIYCGMPEIVDGKVKVSNGCFLEVAGKGIIEIYLTDAEGEFQSKILLDGLFKEKIDITEMLDGRYQFHLQFVFRSGAELHSFRFLGSIMTAPMALPKLIEGENKFTFECKDKFQEKTIPYYLPINFRSVEKLKTNVKEMVNCEIRQERPGWFAFFKLNESMPLEVTFNLNAPQNHPIVWCYFYCLVKEQVKGGEPLNCEIYQSLDAENWELVVEQEVSQSSVYWDCSVEGTSVFTKPVNKVYYKIVSQTNLSAFHPFAHIDFQMDAGSLNVSHEWEEDGIKKEFHVPTGKNEYTIQAGKNPIRLNTLIKNLNS